MELDALHIAREPHNTRLLSVIDGGFPTVELDRGASRFATALHIRERYAKNPHSFGLSLAQHNPRGPWHL